MIKYSLIVPVYNEEKSIATCLNSLKNQIYKKYEIIVIDNNSNDNTIKIARKLVSRIYSEKKQGYIHAVNKGVKYAKGEFIAVCDADAVYPNNWLRKINKNFRKNQNIVAIYGTSHPHDSNKILGFFAYLGFTLFLLISRLFGLDNICGFNFIIRRKDYLMSGGYDKSFVKASPDVMLGIKLKKYGKIKFDISLKVFSSMRRFSKNGFFKTLSLYAKLWYNVLIYRNPKITYSHYNKNAK